MTSYAEQQQRRGGSSRYQSLLYRDLSIVPSSGRPAAGPSSAATPPSAPAASLWRDAAAGSTDPPPPPFFTLDDRLERTPTEPMPEFRSAAPSPMRTTPPQLTSGNSPVSLGFGGSGDFAAAGAATSASPSWWSPLRERGSLAASPAPPSSKELSQQGSGLLTLQTPREIIRPFLTVADQGEEGDEWVTIYGFPGEDTNSVLREFEKCGPIVRHVAGPPNSNWLHIQYQSRQDAQKALLKNGMQLYGALIIGVKPVDPIQRQALIGKSQGATAGFMVMPPKASWKASQAGSRSYYLQGGDTAPVIKSSSTTTTIASPSKSMFSKIADLVFGF